MNTPKLSSIQLLFLVIIFEVGSTTLFALGIGAKQDAWIVILFAYIVGVLLLLCYTQIPRYYNQKDFGYILTDIIGKPFAIVLLFLYSMYFLSQSTHNFYEFGALIKLTALPYTPLWFILYAFIFVVIYILRLGFEVLARTVEIFLPFFIFFNLLIYSFNFFTGELDMSNLLPILGDGIVPILHQLPTVIAFPFGESVVFLMLWHYVTYQRDMRKISIIGMTIAAILLLLSIIIIIGVLGPRFASQTDIPFLEILLSIHVGLIFTNLDSIGVFILFIGGFYKTAIHVYVSSLLLSWIFKKVSKNTLIVIIGLFLPIISLLRFDNLDDQRWKGVESGVYVILIYTLIPTLILLLLVIKNRKQRNEQT
ncbi:GerAB/ArcD/ProY family transporter [Gracilibacillus marinus]|uniref:GerAB/ArcD/ProY family transporter n=1 Tax=Gracilibacillus marinus TaxID=630535 RepID=A0ABV8VPB6_9BACI